MTKLNRSIDRGLTVLEAVHSVGTVSLAVLAARTGLPKPTVLRICKTLEARRWLFRRLSDGNYQLGSAILRSDGMPNRADRLVAVGKQEILRLSEETGLACDLAAGIGGGRVEIVDSTRAFPLHAIYPHAVGFRPSPILSALGAAYLSTLTGEERAKALRDLARGLAREEVKALPRLAAILSDIVARGYAVRSPGHWGRAVDYGALPAAISVPILAGTEPVGAVNLVWNASDHRVETVAAEHLLRLQSAAATIGRTYAEQG